VPISVLVELPRGVEDNGGRNPHLLRGEPGGKFLLRFAEDKNGSPVARDGNFVEDDLEAVADHLEELLGGLIWLGTKISRIFHCGGLRIPAQLLTPAQNPDRAKEMLAMYQQDKEANGYDVAVVGHTHQPGHIEDWYFNSGTWARKTNSFVQISVSGEPSVFDWVDGKREANNTVLEI